MSQTPTVQPNIVDRVVTFFDPVAGGKRLAARSALAWTGAYNGASYGRAQGRNWFAGRGSADADTLQDLHILRPRSRDAMRNQPLALGAVNTVVLNAAGTGLSLQPTPDRTILKWDEDQAHTWTQTVSHEFALFAATKDCDITRTLDFYDAQSLVMRSALESGDCFTLVTEKPVVGGIYDTRFQIIEADRIHSPNGDGQVASVAVGDTKITSGTNKGLWGGGSR